MDQHHYLISEASKKTGTEAHVLRYWEEELELKIPRNELGHRYYTESHIELFQEIMELKNQGYQLKTIRELLVGNELVGYEEELTPKPPEAKDISESTGLQPAAASAEDLIRIQEEKMARFQAIMTDIMADALARNNPSLGEEISSQVGDKLAKEMNYLMREREEQDEERFRRLDEALRTMQKNNRGRAEAAAAKAPVVKMKKKKRFGKQR